MSIRVAFAGLAVAALLGSGAACGGGREEGSEAGAPGAAAAPGDTAPAAGEPQIPRLKPPGPDLLLLEFARAITAADLRWLEENDFRVDTVLSETLVRGWLASPAGERVAHDPRIARVYPLMR